MIDALNITVQLGRKEILHNVDFAAYPGQLTAIVGPNGSGKTTLLRALTGDVDHGGTIQMNGADVTDLPVWKLAALRGVLPQATPLAFPFTVIEVVRLGLMSGTSAQDDRLPERALARVGLAGYEGRYYQELSGGEQQRAQLARVLCQVWEPMLDGAPRWLYLDEPVAALDIAHQIQVMDIARDFAQAGGGVIAVMHDLNLTGLYADRVIIMKNGRVLAAGDTRDVLNSSTLSQAYDCRIDLDFRPAPDIAILHPAGVSLAPL
ncbi:iron complex transport system ATP-binding protein [Aliiroseovarius halocynthiae]|uniref:Heme ABC transporter ATP-binding protein n=1 Tax=Aliiroseovarius halocynthiae TaxID=985055 RepID=A0A545SNW4_9RHOB|nr:heme ABC transporter ATP-binding protein [Aliiroseovarius halocynthiae]TQV66673.1 heme ABC transporter ATP-binding protein [Aliiroseovarius halocynthiae]SMR82448.1 iron complex transport system ATP-binding protein [Aliiroseovarius halocynthiae]